MEEQEVNVRERIRARLDMMSITKTWGRPYFDKLKGTKHIHEIIVKHNKRQYRPLGCFGIGRVFILLVGASKKGAGKRGTIIWDPADAVQTAEKRWELVTKDGRYIGEYRPRKRRAKATPKR